MAIVLSRIGSAISVELGDHDEELVQGPVLVCFFLDGHPQCRGRVAYAYRRGAARDRVRCARAP
jgi:hypothetical protein